MPIHDLKSGRKWTRAGKLKIGEKTPTGTPRKLDHFLFVSEDLELADQFLEIYGEEPKKVDILFLDEDVEFTFPHYHQAWRTSGLWCEGDGEKATRQSKTPGEFAQLQKENKLDPREVPCNADCPFRGMPRNGCSPKGMLRFLLSELRTIRYFEIRVAETSIPRVLGRLEAIRSLSCSAEEPDGHIVGIPLSLIIFPFQGKTKEGKKVTAFGLDLDVPLRPIDLVRGKQPARIPETIPEDWTEAESGPDMPVDVPPPGEENPNVDGTRPGRPQAPPRGTSVAPPTPQGGVNPNFDDAQREGLQATLKDPLFDVDRGGWIDKAKAVSSRKDAADLGELAAKALAQRKTAEAEKPKENYGETDGAEPPDGAPSEEAPGVDGFLASLEAEEAAAKAESAADE